MIEIKWIVLSKDALIDRDTGELNLIRVMSSFRPNELPIFLQKISASVYLRRDPFDSETADATLRITVDGEEKFKFPVGIDFQDKPNCHSVTNIQGFVIDRPGTWEFEFSASGMEPHSAQLYVDPPAANI